MIYVCDFETTGFTYYKERGKAEVYLFCLSPLTHFEPRYGHSIKEFWDWLTSQDEPVKVYFHNLRFDSSFLIDYFFRTKKDKDYVLKSSYSFQKDPYYLRFFSNKRKIKDYNRATPDFEILDSLKILILPIAKLGSLIGLPKLGYDYDFYYQKQLTSEDYDYVTRDVEILQRSLSNFFEFYETQKTTRKKKSKEPLTISQASRSLLFNYMKKSTFEELFKEKNYQLTRDSYIGGFCHLNKKYKGIKLEGVSSFDINSSYPSIFVDYDLPFGDGKVVSVDKWRRGKHRNTFNFITFRIEDFKAKTHPFLIAKSWMQNEYLDEGEELTMTLTEPEFLFIKNNYEFKKLTVLQVESFQKGKFFIDYIKFLYENKKTATDKTQFKRLLNSFTGKFGQAEIMTGYEVIGLKNNETFKFQETKHESNQGYLPLIVALLSYARLKLYSIIEKLGDDFVYSDTDSIYFLNLSKNRKLFKEGDKLGEWDLEHENHKFLGWGQKTYLCGDSKHLVGLKTDLYPRVTYENFKPGLSFEGVVLKSKKVKGGVLLYPGDFRLKERS